ncbi:hypothetical protein Q8W40_05410 [Vibrio penaeicida]|uniref:hypothetical protein n=1 Tax=Vibrio penaeicida TaxID=104609 RepID=UPI0027338D1C|nr:hypothetical protein [Vibrio penaeicida]MDP2571612.1 hypothetical protein [Vibrio penaeicida]
MFEEFDSFLSMSYSVDYWEDEGISIADSKLYDFSEQDWLELKSTIDLRGEQWQVRCIGVLGDQEHKNAFQILIKQAESSKSQQVQVAALDSINSILSFGKPSTEEKALLREVIDKFTSSSSIESMLVDSLRKKVV